MEVLVAGGKLPTGTFTSFTRLPSSYIYPPNIFRGEVRGSRLTRRFAFERGKIRMGNRQVGLSPIQNLPRFSPRCGLLWDSVVFSFSQETADQLIHSQTT